ncbi:Small nucleolar ribonucleoprotein complex subunit [Mycena indigotica]|uniref:Small nucleolar ribonucleoprotein complex subunit n=1 Tax=Mycena indigotica TaxID=2126181 RepID=A0A8H6SWA6_9AGAR|nr:Small nucleolar ribonucleoprotein complex subunit [Mycena indigotica]KAF7307108.1 Small nucleolar ribonucleoprotein complex subunit [Mycena indigotica]
MSKFPSMMTAAPRPPSSERHEILPRRKIRMIRSSRLELLYNNVERHDSDCSIVHPQFVGSLPTEDICWAQGRSTSPAMTYSVSRNGGCFHWEEKRFRVKKELIASTLQGTGSNIIANTRWGVYKRHCFNQANTKSRMHHITRIPIVGFPTGVYDHWEMSAFSNVHVSGEEFFFLGAKKLGQLLVREWQSELYIPQATGPFPRHEHPRLCSRWSMAKSKSGPHILASALSP